VGPGIQSNQIQTSLFPSRPFFSPSLFHAGRKNIAGNPKISFGPSFDPTVCWDQKYLKRTFFNHSSDFAKVGPKPPEMTPLPGRKKISFFLKLPINFTQPG